MNKLNLLLLMGIIIFTVLGCPIAGQLDSVDDDDSVPNPTALIIYDDQLKLGFADWSYSCIRDFSDSSQKHTGSKSISCDVNPSSYGGLQLVLNTSPGVDVSAYTKLTFWINGGSASTKQNLQVKMSSTTDSSTAYVGINTVLTGGVEAGAWKKVTVLFTALSATFTLNSLKRVDITSYDNSFDQETFYVDDIQFE